MNIEELRNYCLSIKGATESFPFSSFGNKGNDILVFKVMNKMFAYIDLFPSDLIFRILLKSEPATAEKLQEKYEGISNSARKLEKNWKAIELNSDVPDDLLKQLIHHSVDLVIKTLPQRKQQEYKELFDLNK